MKKRQLILSICMSFILAFALPAYAQQPQKVEGTVIAENGEAIIGASIMIEGTNVGTITDINGHFTIQVPAKGKLAVSYVGSISQIISDLNNPRIVLKDAKQLDEVVVVGYGSQKMRNVTGALETISPKEISDLAVSNLSLSLSGLVNGLSVSGGNSRPGDAASLTIRQASVAAAFSPGGGDASPLYVIDDYIATATAFNNLDASVIENITVLKDGAAAVYGARSAQGVILVKTKRGQIGAPKISYSGQFGYDDAISHAKMLSAYDYGTLWNGVKGGAILDNTSIDSRRDLFQADELQSMKSLNYNLLKQEWSPAITQKHSLNISGGSDNATYFAGVSYFTQDGNLGWINYNRWNYRAGVDAKISKSIKASVQVSGDYGTKSTAVNKIGGSNGETDYNTLLAHPLYVPDNINGMPLANFGVSNTLVNNIQYYNYKAIQNMNNYSNSSPQNMNINTSLEYDFGWSKILKGLKFKATYSKTISTTQNDNLSTYVTVYKMLTRGGTGNHLYTGDGLDVTASNFSTINSDNGHSISRSMSRYDSYQLNFYATYARKFGLHDVSALFTVEKSENQTEDVNGYVLDPYSFTNGQSTSASGTQTTDFGRTEAGMLSYVGRLNYSYADKYLAEFLVRTDASTKFAPENYWGVFPSLSLGWVMSEEQWFKRNIEWVDFFKLRGSVGLLGMDNIPAWAWMQTYGVIANKGAVFGTSPTTNMGGGTSSSDAPNRDAHWNNSYKTNFGIDTHLLQSRLSVSVDAYYDMSRDVFMSRSGSDNFPATVGTKPTAENFGALDTYGVELSVGWKDKIGKDFSFYVKLNTGYNDSKMIKMYWPSQITIDGQHPNQRTDLGTWGMDAMGMFRSYQQINEYVDKYHITNYLGLTPDKIRPGMLIYRDVRGPQNSDGSYQAPDGVINATTDIVKISNRAGNPYGFTTNFGAEWKGLSFSAQLSANWGGYTIIPKSARSATNLISSGGDYNDLQYTNMPSFWANNMYVYNDVLDATGNIVAAQNRNATYPSLLYSVNNLNSTFWAVSSTRITFRNITVAYSLPKKFINKLGLSSCRFNLTGQNILSLYNPYPDSFIDPLSGTYGNYPTLRTVSMGVNVSF